MLYLNYGIFNLVRIVMTKPSKEDVQKAMDSVKLWRPGYAAITDLGRFRGCVAKNNGGKLATSLFDQFDIDFKNSASAAKDKYEGPGLLPPKNAQAFLKNAKREMKTLESGKRQSYECSSFSYSAISELMLNDDIRENYDILQMGTMRINQGRGFGMNYAHNIAVLIPKPPGAKDLDIPKDGPLPKGALIVDPWARSLGHPAEKTLGVSEDNFQYKGTLYPLVVNYNSAKEENLNEVVAEFKEDEKYYGVDIDKDRKEAHDKVPIFVNDKPSRTISPPSHEAPRQTTVFPESYGQMWNQARQEAANDSSPSRDKEHLAAMKKILNDYTKGNSRFKRIVCCHWNRHHVKEVHDIVQQIGKEGGINDPKSLMKELDKFVESKDMNPCGSFKKRLDFMKKEISGEPRQERVIGNR
jgi:RavJ, Peptidase domain/Domain of unknown function (DUF5617)